MQYKLNDTKIERENKKSCVQFMCDAEIKKALAFHRSFPQYSVTPLRNLKNLANKLGVAGIYLKDESYRFGLNAFKVLGGSYAIGRFIAQTLGRDISELPFDVMRSPETRAKLGDVTFFTATDGNHGRGVAWACNQLNQKSVVYMPKGSSQIRLQNILKENADASITDMNYDDAVRLADANSKKIIAAGGHAVVIQDTAWEGYEDIPAWIMQGYGTLALEALEQLKTQFEVERPTHVFLQAGVGSFAGAVQGLLAATFGDNCPITVVVEPSEAACLYKSAVEGRRSFVAGDMPSICAGLCCGEPNTISWEVLRNHTSCFVSCPDSVAADGMRVLGNPLNGDDKVISGESGALPAGLVYNLLTRKGLYAELKKDLKIDENSRILLVSTEGDTDPDMYRKIVWEGYYPHN